MDAQCASCGGTFEAQRSSAKYCGQTCRKRGSRRGEVATLPPADEPVGLVAATLAELQAAGRADTALGQQALALAERVNNPRDTGSAIAALSRELRAVMVEALKGVEVAADPLDELRARRDRIRSAG